MPIFFSWALYHNILKSLVLPMPCELEPHVWNLEIMLFILAIQWPHSVAGVRDNIQDMSEKREFIIK